MKTLRTLAVGLAAVALMFALTNSARAIIAIGDPQDVGSWAQRFVEDMNASTHLEAFMRSSGDAFEAYGFVNFSFAGWAGALISPDHIVASGALAPINTQFDIKFMGLRSEPLIFDFYAWNGNTLVDHARANWNGGGWSFTTGSAPAPQVLTPVPEPTTMIAGALLLLPFGASTLRVLRKRQTA